MEQHMQIDEQVTVGGQPDEQQLEQLSQDGFKTIVNMRTEGEDDMPFSPEDEGQRVQRLGMHYVHFPVSKEAMSAEQVDRFRERMAQWSKPMFVHCNSGKRSGAFIMMDRAVKQGWSGADTLEQAEDMGFECDVPEIKELVKNYVDSRQA